MKSSRCIFEVLTKGRVSKFSHFGRSNHSMLTQTGVVGKNMIFIVGLTPLLTKTSVIRLGAISVCPTTLENTPGDMVYPMASCS